MTLRAVLFDLWGTLILDTPERSRPRQGWRAGAVHGALAAHGFYVDLDLVLQTLIKASSELGTLQDRGIDFKAGGRAQLFADLFAQTTGLTVPESSLPEVEHAIGQMPPEYSPVPEPHAMEALATIKARGFTTGLISNAGLTTAPHLRRILADYEFTPYLDYLVFSDELGVAKPAPSIFQEALDGLCLAADACAYVGDSPHNDIAGAATVGMFTVQIGARTRDGITPHARIETLDQLLPALQTHANVAKPSAG